ncbi:SagB family peptide dehydrogenase [Plantactinospora sp. B24E8]|uniref:SagB family peptide dehydrogenase n=1 Tax=Plantactinospora sp. B24E8 TaxID=3153567 RepID=UPI00325EE8E6
MRDPHDAGAATDRPRVRESYRLRTDAQLLAADGGLALRQTRFRLPLDNLGVGGRALVLRLAERWVDDLELHRLVSGLEGEGQVLRAQVLLRRLVAHSWLRRRLTVADRVLLDVVPRGLGAGSAPVSRRHDPATTYRLSRFATLCPGDDGLTARTPLGRTVLDRLDPALVTLLGLAARGVTPTDAATALDVDEQTAGRVLDELLTAGILGTAAERAEEETDPRLAYWATEELAVHDRSRPGGHVAPVGATYPFRDTFAPAPLRRVFPGVRTVPLAVPDMELAAKRDDPLTEVVRARRSIREHDDANPLTVDQLAEFLYRVQHTMHLGEAAGQQVGRRPYPTAGSLCELEIYPVVTRCAGLAAGLYHYDAVGHRLELLAERAVVGSKLVEYARSAGAMTAPPQVLLVVTARLERLKWKYEGLAYPLLLKDAGVLTGLMYLVATAMGLAPCALGAGQSAAFADLAGVDPLVEPSVADFLLGSCRAATAADGSGSREGRA